MTLRRKNIAPHAGLVTTYGVMLTAGFCISTIDHLMHGSWLLVNSLATLAAILRLGLSIPKYPLWAGLGVGLYFCREALVLREGDGKSLGLRVAGFVALQPIILTIGARKMRKYATQAAAATKSQ